MCGILGWLNPSFKDSLSSRHQAEDAMSTLRSRGPDGWRLEASDGWLLGHARLAIIDLSDQASQPMTDGKGRWLVYNGEIYNFRELRDELVTHGYRFKSNSDSEVVLHALDCWGVSCLIRFRGMFAFALLDNNRHQLILCRDRYGVKPLAYELRGRELRFASNLFALRALPDASAEIDSEAAYLFMALGYVPAPLSIMKGIRKVKPGHYVVAKWNNEGVESFTEHSYWSVADILDKSTDPTPDKDLVYEYESRVAEAVRYRLISDVPLGSLLSGGIDSSLVTAFAREQSESPVPTFTMGFDDPASNEAPFAKAIAEKLGGSHTEFYMTEADALRAWSDLWQVYDEPFADSSALPMLGISRGVAGHVKVALSGDGGDEVFCGYPWHRALDRAEHSDFLPRQIRRSVAAAIGLLSPTIRYRANVVGQPDRVSQWSALRTGLSNGMSRCLPVEGAESAAPVSDYFRGWSEGIPRDLDPLNWACHMELRTYLPDDLLVKADRASMSVGLELREPLLDHELTEWVLRLPIETRYDRKTRTGKLLARSVLESKMASSLFDRPKQGFTPPLRRWLGGALAPVKADAIRRLSNGDLYPLRLPNKAADWQQCSLLLNDLYQQFTWRVICFSEWMKQVPKSESFQSPTLLEVAG